MLVFRGVTIDPSIATLVYQRVTRLVVFFVKVGFVSQKHLYRHRSRPSPTRCVTLAENGMAAWVTTIGSMGRTVD